MTLSAPFPWFGGKRRVAPIVWQRFGDVPNYVEPFAGSLAVLLDRPGEPRIETVNDANAYLANFWRALAGEHADPDAVAYYADYPVNEADLHARHRWLVESCADRVERIMSDPDHFDAKVAGWWVWGQCLWIGSGWCQRPEWKGRVNCGRNSRGIHADHIGGVAAITDNEFTYRKRPVLGRGGERRVLRRGLNEPDEAPAGQSLPRQIVDLSGEGGAAGRGIAASGFTKRTGGIYAYMRALADRLRRVRVCCGDWSRVVTPAVTTCIGVTGVFLDPPYSKAERDPWIYAEDHDVAVDVRAWAIANGDNPALRIALCGYAGEHEMPASWSCFAWKASGGYGSRTKRGQANARRERIWFSPHCLTIEQSQLEFAEIGA